MPTYTRANLYTDIRSDSSGIKNIDRIVNRAVRDVISEIDVRSTKRRAYISPALGKEQYDYQAPSDLKEWAVIDIRRIEDRRKSDKFVIVQSEYFDRHKTYNKNLICIEDREFLPKLRVSANLRSNDSQAVIHNMDDHDANGTWATTLDASLISTDLDVFIEGDGSVRFAMDQSATTVTTGILTNPNMDSVDLTDYDNGSVFVYVYAPSVTSLTNFILRIGNSASVYFEKTVTVTNENLAFHTGWMLLRFDLASATETGSVDLSAIDYVRLTLTRTGSVAGTDWRYDYIVARRGVFAEVWYYSKYGWQTSAGSYLENSTANTDKVNCDTEEYELYVLKGKQLLAEDLKLFDEAELYRTRYERAKENYKTRYPSERLQIKQTYYDFGSDVNEAFLD